MGNINVYLIRHGYTFYNEKKLYCGQLDPCLSNFGVLKLYELKKTLNYPKFCDAYFTSGYKRANQTFEILYPNTKYQVINGFCEYNFGEFEGKSYEDLKNNQNYINWLNDEQGNFSLFKGETKNEYNKRVKEAFNSFIHFCVLKKYMSVLLVSHGGTIGTILEHFYSNTKSFYEWQPSCGHGYKLDIEFNNYVKIIGVYNL